MKLHNSISSLAETTCLWSSKAVLQSTWHCHYNTQVKSRHEHEQRTQMVSSITFWDSTAAHTFFYFVGFLEGASASEVYAT